MIAALPLRAAAGRLPVPRAARRAWRASRSCSRTVDKKHRIFQRATRSRARRPASRCASGRLRHPPRRGAARRARRRQPTAGAALERDAARAATRRPAWWSTRRARVAALLGRARAAISSRRPGAPSARRRRHGAQGAAARPAHARSTRRSDASARWSTTNVAVELDERPRRADQPRRAAAAGAERGARAVPGRLPGVGRRAEASRASRRCAGAVARRAARRSSSRASCGRPRSSLQATIEELETLERGAEVARTRSCQSINEELQSANEELQTSKEELQSVNEELETVNAELNKKVEELDRANSDLQNLFAEHPDRHPLPGPRAAHQALHPGRAEVFRLIDSDVGRPIADIAPRFRAAIWWPTSSEVLRTLAARERQVAAQRRRRAYLLRILPYRTARQRDRRRRA